ncbi:hypothetical protein Afil01_22180 [Actinorhabdospora filicis]|uniref:DSBA-like thioredoxin domain-containing protein n=1 Tax=Actinorhabdospora filicis TaxID=1785913 RepID=A0A9W6SMQ2_9ACTN|nr:tetratricopeptide repeat protein [Actinorhabdospora filicis]GLZ77411.1 hypothetical protein Afil01_22180 [Actinorhabdospora filicis]
MRIELWLDPTGGWTFVAKNRVDAALELWDGDPVEVVWRPALADPRGSVEPLLLLWHAYETGGTERQAAVADLLWRAHSLEGADITDPEVLSALARETGWEPDLAAADRVAFREEMLRGKAIGVTGSPALSVGERVLTGDPTPEQIVEFLRDSADDPALPDEVRRLRLAEALLGRKDPLGALVILKPLLEEFGGDPNVRMLAARAYFASAQLRRAEELLTALVERDPGDFYARYLLGRTYQRQGRAAEAAPHLALTETMFD